MVGFKIRLFWFAFILKPNYFNMFGSDNASLQLNLLSNSKQLIQLKPKNHSYLKNIIMEKTKAV